MCPVYCVTYVTGCTKYGFVCFDLNMAQFRHRDLRLSVAFPKPFPPIDDISDYDYYAGAQ